MGTPWSETHEEHVGGAGGGRELLALACPQSWGWCDRVPGTIWMGWEGSGSAGDGAEVSPAALGWDGCSMALWWVVALLGTAPAVSEVAASRVGACTGVAQQDAAGERIPLALPMRQSGSAPTPCSWWGHGALCHGAVEAAQPAMARPAAEPCSPSIPWGSGKRAFMALRGQRPLSRRNGAVSCLWSTAEVRNTLVRPDLASPTLPGELAGVTARVRKQEEEAAPSSCRGDGGLGQGPCGAALETYGSPQSCWQSTGAPGPSPHAGLVGMPEQAGCSAATRCRYGPWARSCVSHESGPALGRPAGIPCAEVSALSRCWQQPGPTGVERIGRGHSGEVLARWPGEQPQVGAGREVDGASFTLL